MTDDRDTHDVEQRLAKAWLAAPAPTPTQHWKAGVMRAVHAQADAADATEEGAPLLTLVRNALFVAASAAALVATYTFTGVSRLDPREELVRVIGQDPHTVLELFWVL